MVCVKYTRVIMLDDVLFTKSLDEQRKQLVLLQLKLDEIKDSLKKNVYENYSLFVGSSKEIALLEEQMGVVSSKVEDLQSMGRKLRQSAKTSTVTGIGGGGGDDALDKVLPVFGT